MPRVKLFDEQEVLEKAMHLFWKQGYHATSMQHLVEHLGINRASLYGTYGSKRTLFEQAFAHYRKTNTLTIEQFLNKQEDVKKGLKDLFILAIETSAADADCKGCFVVNTTAELIPNDVGMTKLLEENKDRIEGILYNYLSMGVDRGQISSTKDIRAITTLLFTFYNGLKVVTKVSFDQQAFHKSVDALLTVLD